MITTNYHIHSRYCDGRGELDDYVQEAIARQLVSIGFSSHAPLPFGSQWAMSAAQLPHYLADIQQCRVRYADRIAIHAGLELDYIPGPAEGHRAKLLELPLDYVIGVVHLVGGEHDSSHWTVDGAAQPFEVGLHERYHGDIRSLVCEYFGRMRAMVERSDVDILGHFDRLLYQNAGERLFALSAPWYVECVEETLQTIADHDLLMELNVAGWFAPLGQPYPTPAALRRCHELGIRITVGTDAHRPENVARGLDLAQELLTETGYREIWRLEQSHWAPYPIS